MNRKSFLLIASLGLFGQSANAAVPLTVGGEWGTPLSLVARYGLTQNLTAEGAIGRRSQRWIENRAGLLFEYPVGPQARPYTGLQAIWGSAQKTGVRVPFGFHFGEQQQRVEIYAEFAPIYHGAHSSISYESGIGLLFNPFALFGL